MSNCHARGMNSRITAKESTGTANNSGYRKTKVGNFGVVSQNQEQNEDDTIQVHDPLPHSVQLKRMIKRGTMDRLKART
jgi:hypothetical protein